MEIQLPGFDRLQRAFMQSPQLVERDLLAWADTTTAHLTDEITSLTPKDTGLLQQSIKPSVVQVGALGVSAVIGTPLSYARPVEFGSEPHDILPKNGKALHFMMRGIPITVKKVHHPGSKGYFMFSRAFDANLQQVQDSFVRMVDRVLAKIAAGAV
jgi:hypothetical protein